MVKKTKIIAGFPGVGKSYFTKHTDLDVSDSDSSKFSWIYNDDGTKERNPDFIKDYMTHIKSMIGEKDIIFTSTHKEVIDALYLNGLKDITRVVLPTRSSKPMYMERYKQRGNDDSFIKLMDDNFENFIDDLHDNMSKGKCVLFYIDGEETIESVMSEILSQWENSSKLDTDNGGKPKKKYFYIDTEFTGLHKGAELLAMSAITEDGDMFFWSTDVYPDVEKVTDEPFVNKIYQLNCDKDTFEYIIYNEGLLGEDVDSSNIIMSINTSCPKTNLRQLFTEFVDKYTEKHGVDMIEVVMDVSPYHWVMFVDGVYEHALGLDDRIFYVPTDLFTLMAHTDTFSDPDQDRLELYNEIKELDGEVYPKVVKNNALGDAYMVKTIHEYLLKTTNLNK